jgi:hypothetical protein
MSGFKNTSVCVYEYRRNKPLSTYLLGFHFTPLTNSWVEKLVQTYALHVSLETSFYPEIFILSSEISLFSLGKIKIS